MTKDSRDDNWFEANPGETKLIAIVLFLLLVGGAMRLAVTLDLLPGMLAYAEDNDIAFEDFTLGCDGHWGTHGHEATARIVYDYLIARDARSAPAWGLPLPR